ncbi:MAG: hypothetical protein NTU63_02685 [Candidatus Pacearchaeota archaeon]|nr:hypothetical protein [Candidatus Pacearchaeota archaeon]
MKKKEEIPWKIHLIIGILIFLVLSLLILNYFFFFKKTITTCGDGTLYEECSFRKPYFCSDGILLKKASICGCPEILTINKVNEDECVSKYEGESKQINLKYVLRGEEYIMNILVYKKLYDYVSKLSRSIDYSAGEEPSLLDFKLMKIDEIQQRQLLLPFVTKIQNIASNKEDQARIAISIIQNIPFGSSNKTFKFGNSEMEYSRYPYEVLYDMEGICGEKTELLIFLLRELGYGTAFIHYQSENHEAVGIKCPIKYGVDNTEYCFVETTGPSIITDDETEYSEFGKLSSVPEIVEVSNGISLGNKIYEYKDAEKLMSIREAMQKYGRINMFQYYRFNKLKEKYGLEDFSDSYVF